MNKLNPDTYNRLFLQAEEAKEIGLVKLADTILEAIGPESANAKEIYPYSQLQKEIHSDLWKIAIKLIDYYDANSVDALKLDNTIITWATRTIEELENTMNLDDVIAGPNEPRLPGETK